MRMDRFTLQPRLVSGHRFSDGLYLAGMFRLQPLVTLNLEGCADQDGSSFSRSLRRTYRTINPAPNVAIPTGGTIISRMARSIAR